MMVSGATIVLIVYFIQGTLGHAVPPSPFVGIVGGDTVDIAEAPYMASVHVGDTSCGGSVIHEQFVLTAAHCVSEEYPIPADYVRVGTNRYDSGGKKYTISDFIWHEYYNNASEYSEQYDVALLKLSNPLNFNYRVVEPITLGDSKMDIYPGLIASVYGWDMDGNIDENSELRQVSVTVASLSTCILHHKKGITDKSICVSQIGGGSCNDDSGGPLVAGGRQIGIVTGGGEHCGYTPGVYVNVAAHTKWIHEKITQHAPK